MALNAKPAILFDNRFDDGTITAYNGTASGYDVLNVSDLRSYTFWKSAATASNILYVDSNIAGDNGDFEDGDTGSWSVYTSGGAAASLAVDSTPGGPHEGTYYGILSITDGGSTSDNIQVNRTGIPIVKGREYTVVFAAKAASSRPMYLNLIRAVTPWDNYGLSENITLTTSWQRLEYTFTATATDENATLNMAFGGHGAETYLDMLYITSPADSIAILGHNLNTTKHSVALQSNDIESNVSGQTDHFDMTDSELCDDNGIIFQTFTETSARFWFITFTESGTASEAPALSVAMIGKRLEFEQYAKGGFAPGPEKINAEAGNSRDGNHLGVALRSGTTKNTATFENQTDAFVTGDFRVAWKRHLRQCKPFFFAWDYTNHPTEIEYVRVPPGTTFSAPFNGSRRTITLPMEGVKE